MGRVTIVVLFASLVAGLGILWSSAAQAGADAIPASSRSPASLGGGGYACGEPLTEQAGTRVEIANFCFSPTVLHVEPGSEVEWTNLDSAQHNVVAVGAIWSDAELLSRGQTTTVRFEEKGIFPYFCQIHPGMVGVVVVEGGSEAAGSVGSQDNTGESSPWLTPSASLLAGSGLSIAAAGGFGVALVWRRRH